MKVCQRCGLPMIWSEDQQRMWCSVYGDHKPIPTNVVVGARYPWSSKRVDWRRAS